MTLYHGSLDALDSGTVLAAKRGGYVDQADGALEKLFEETRPDGCVPRAQAVFLVEDPGEVDAAGGYCDNVYVVEPVGLTGRHDLAWYSEAQCALDEGDEEKARQCAKSYWAGSPYAVSESSLFETLATAAVVVRDVPDFPSR